MPLLIAAWKLASALAAGNTSVLKPAETTSITAMHLAEIFQEAELPDGVVNIVTGAAATGQALVEHDVNKIAFTGSTSVGKMLTQAVAGTKKSLTLDSAARRPTSFSRTRRSTRRSKELSREFISIKAMSAVPGRVCSCRKAFSLPSSANCAIASRRQSAR